MLVVLAAIVIAAVARPVIWAADAVLRVAVDALEVAAIAVASIAGLAVLAGVALLAVRLYRWRSRTGNRQPIPPHAPLLPRAARRISAPRPAAIPAPRNLPAIGAQRAVPRVVPHEEAQDRESGQQGR